MLAADVEVGVYGVERRLPERHQAPLLALAERRDQPLGAVDVGELEADDLAHSEPGGVHHLEEGAVPQAAEPGALGRVEDARDLVEHQHLGEAPGEARPLDERAGIVVGSARSRTRKRTKPRTAERCRAADRAPRPCLPRATM